MKIPALFAVAPLWCMTSILSVAAAPVVRSRAISMSDSTELSKARRNLRDRRHDDTSEANDEATASISYVECVLMEMDIIVSYDYQTSGVSCMNRSTMANIEVHGLQENVPFEWTSGVTMVKLLSTAIQDEMIQITENWEKEILFSESQTQATNEKDETRRLQSTFRTGTHNVLVVRVTAKDKGPSFTAKEIGDSIFGNVSDIHNLASQYDACSYGKLKMVQYSNRNYGVLEVNVARNAIESTGSQLQSDAAQNLPDYIKKDINAGNIQHVMYCVPQPKSFFIAWAHSNDVTSVYNDKFCLGISTQMHEVGHNLGMQHSGLNGNKYNDRSGYMGYSGSQSDTPLQCFNGPKSYQMGWYNDKVVNLSNYNTFDGKLVGVAHYGQAKSNANLNVIVRISPPRYGYDDIFVTYNREVGINQGSPKGAAVKDKVLVTSGGPNSVSWNLAQLDPRSGQFLLDSSLGFPNNLWVITNGSGTDNNADYANVIVALPCSKNSDCKNNQTCDLSMGSSLGLCKVDQKSWDPTVQTSRTLGASSTKDQKAAHGVMWEVYSAESVRITGLSILSTATGSVTLNIWTKEGTAKGQDQNDARRWNKKIVASAYAKGMGELTQFNFSENDYIDMTAAANQAFYIEFESSSYYIAFKSNSCSANGGVIDVETQANAVDLKGWYSYFQTTGWDGCFNGEIRYQTYG